MEIGSWPVLPIFDIVKKLGNMEDKDIYNTFNMGIGMVIVVGKDLADNVLSTLDALGEKAYIIGEIKSGGEGVELCQK